MGRKTTVSETRAGRQCKSPSNAMPSKTLPQETSLESLFDVKGFLFVMRNELRCHRARLVGMSLFWAWLQLVFTTRLYLSESCAADNAPQLQQFVWLASLACTLATFCVVLVIANRLPPRWERKSSTLAASHALMAIGTMMLVLSSRGDGTAWMLLIGTLATGIGSGVAFLLWGAHLSAAPARCVLFDMGIYALLTAALSGIFLRFPRPALQIGVIALPALSGVLLVAANRRENTAPVNSQPLSADYGPAGLLGKPWGLMAIAVFVGLVFGLMRSISLYAVGPLPDMATSATIIGIAISGVLLLTTILFYRHDSELYLICQVAFPLLALGFLLLHVVKNGILPISVFMVGHNYFYSLLWVLFVLHSQKNPGRGSVVFACGLLAFLGSSFAGSLVGLAPGLVKAAGSREFAIVTLVVLYLFVLVLAFAAGSRVRESQEELNRRALAFKAATERIAAAYGLSQREEEVFHLVALGRDRADICEVLGIATDTVKAHTRHVYTKLGIHSKKEAAMLVAGELAGK